MNIMTYLIYTMTLATAVIIMLDLIAADSKPLLRVGSGLLAIALGVSLAIKINDPSVDILLLFVGTAGLVYARNWLKGIVKFTTVVSSISFFLLALAIKLPGIGLWARYKEYMYLLFNLSIYIVPALLILALWHQLPLCYHALRRASRREK